MYSVAIVFVLVAGVPAEDPKAVEVGFEDAALGTVPKGWTVAQTGAGAGSEWKVIEDKTATKGSKVLAQLAESPSAVFNLCVAGNTSFQDVEITVAFKAVQGKTDQGGGVVWRYADANNYYIARYNPLESNYRVYKVVDGKRTQLATKEGLKAVAGEWHVLTVRMRGKEIVCLLDGQEYLRAKDDAIIKSGQVGLWTKADARTSFDDFRAQRLTK
jgi:hypothetical protein